jgi:non-ribosomal peptide synthetase component F
MPMTSLHHYLESSARRLPYNPAVVAGDGAAVTYAQLDTLANRLRDRLIARGVKAGDRVALVLPTSIEAIAAVFGVLKAGAAYVPVDPAATVEQVGRVLGSNAPTAIIAEASQSSRLKEVVAGQHPALAPVGWIEVDPLGAGEGLDRALSRLDRAGTAPSVPSVIAQPDGPACVISTANDNGNQSTVPVSHRAAAAFIDWCSGVLHPSANDRFTSHAPLDAAASMLDLFLPIKHGASIVLMPDGLTAQPRGIADFVERMRISVWGATPAVLTNAARVGHLREHNYSRLRAVLCATDEGSTDALHVVAAQLPHPRYLSLSGPLVANAYAWHEVQGSMTAERGVRDRVDHRLAALQVV